MAQSKNLMILSWILQLLVAGLLIMASIPKFAGAEESVALFNGMPGTDVLRYFTATLEIAAALLILFPRTIPYGAIVALLGMSGALGSHLLYLGFEGEMGMMTMTATGIFIAAAVVLFLRRKSLPFFN